MKKIKEEKQMKKQNKRIEIRNEKIKMEKGITILALVITIIVLLILAGITINAITGDNGLIGNAGTAKEEAEIANEKEILEEATVSSMGKDKYGNLKQETLQEELSDNDVEVTQSGNNFICKFPSEREYIVDQDGDITEKKGFLASEISAENYGNYVMNYSDIDVADGGESQKSDWQIYYAGKVADEAEEHIYLISSNYISVESIPASKNNHTLNKGSYPYSAYFPDNVFNDYPNGSDDVAEETRYLNGQYYEYLTYNNTKSTNTNMKVVAYMCDTSVWNIFKTDKAEFAIGSPTIELLFKSYNKKYGKNYLAGSLESNETSKDSEGNPVASVNKNGYRLSCDGGITWQLASNTGTITANNSLYYIYGAVYAQALWLASPSASQPWFIMKIYNAGFVNYDGYNAGGMGFRPIVCLKPDVQLEKVEDGYRIVE